MDVVPPSVDVVPAVVVSPDYADGTDSDDGYRRAKSTMPRLLCLPRGEGGLGPFDICTPREPHIGIVIPPPHMYRSVPRIRYHTRPDGMLARVKDGDESSPDDGQSMREKGVMDIDLEAPMSSIAVVSSSASESSTSTDSSPSLSEDDNAPYDGSPVVTLVSDSEGSISSISSTSDRIPYDRYHSSAAEDQRLPRKALELPEQAAPMSSTPLATSGSIYSEAPSALNVPPFPTPVRGSVTRSSDRIRALQASLGGDSLAERHGKAPPSPNRYYASDVVKEYEGQDGSHEQVAQAPVAEVPNGEDHTIDDKSPQLLQLRMPVPEPEPSVAEVMMKPMDQTTIIITRHDEIEVA